MGFRLVTAWLSDGGIARKYRVKPGREHRLSLTIPIEIPSGFSRTHPDDGTQLTGGTQSPGNLGTLHSPPRPASMHSLDTCRSPTATFPMVQDVALPPPPPPWPGLFQQGRPTSARAGLGRRSTGSSIVAPLTAAEMPA